MKLLWHNHRLLFYFWKSKLFFLSQKFLCVENRWKIEVLVIVPMWKRSKKVSPLCCMMNAVQKTAWCSHLHSGKHEHTTSSGVDNLQGKNPGRPRWVQLLHTKSEGRSTFKKCEAEACRVSVSAWSSDPLPDWRCRSNFNPSCSWETQIMVWGESCCQISHSQIQF